MNDLLSIILLSFNSEKQLSATTKKIMDTMEAEAIPFEIIIIDDGSTDSSFEQALELEKANASIRSYQLSRNYTSPYAQFAGIQLAKGGCSIPVPDDLQRPLDVVVKMYRSWQSGNKVVIAHHDVRDDGRANDFFSKTFYKIMNHFSDIRFPPGGADGALIDREIMDIMIKHISPRNTTPVLEVLRMGYQPAHIPFERPPSVGRSRWTLKKKIKLASDSFFSSSNFPIRFITTIGFLTFIFSFALIIAIIAAKLFSNNQLFGFPVQGWATIVVLVSFFNGLVLFCLGIVAAYIWRIYEEVKGRPGYIIKQKADDA